VRLHSCDPTGVAFHVQVRQFPHLARAFNLTADELSSSLLDRWSGGGLVVFQERTWDPRRARLTIYEGPPLRADQIGLGRGWTTVARTGTDVTDTLLGASPAAASADLGARIVDRCAIGPVALGEVVEMADAARASERLALAETAAWGLLHAGAVRMLRRGEPVPREHWECTLLQWRSWHDSATTLELATPQATTSAISRSRSASDANR
jgi:hypothetical protein